MAERRVLADGAAGVAVAASADVAVSLTATLVRAVKRRPSRNARAGVARTVLAP